MVIIYIYTDGYIFITNFYDLFDGLLIGNVYIKGWVIDK